MLCLFVEPGLYSSLVIFFVSHGVCSGRVAGTVVLADEAVVLSTQTIFAYSVAYELGALTQVVSI
jgi:hypothetical protein